MTPTTAETSTSTETPTSTDEARALPLVTDADIERRVADLIGRANLRQLWLLFLDDADIQLPLLIPVDGLPTEPSVEQVPAFASNIAELMIEIGANRVIAVWERYGAVTLTPQDAAWARALDESCREQGVALRGTLLSHRTGVRWVSPEEYALSETRGPGASR
jgi:hypothetical protein